MNIGWITAAGVTLLSLTAHQGAMAIDARYAQQLERSGCTQMSEMQGCDIHKSKAENAKAGFVKDDPSAMAQTPYAGTWVARNDSGATVATIEIDGKERVKVNGRKVRAKRADGALIFRDGTITYTIQGDRRLRGEDVWIDADAGTRGLISTP